MEKSGAQMEFEAALKNVYFESGQVEVDREKARQDHVRFLARLSRNFYGTVREEFGPEMAERLYQEQHAITECRRRAATNSELLDMRLD